MRKIVKILIVFIFLNSCSDGGKNVSFSTSELLFSYIKSNEESKDKEFYLQSFPKDISQLEVDQRKYVFINSLLPLIENSNREIIRTRELILNFQKKGKNKVSKKDQFTINKLFQKYRVPNENIEALLYKVDIIPNSMVLAQAAIESGWGTSRFCLEGNAIFGEHSNDVQDVMEAEFSDVKMRRFENLQESVDSYFLNVNRHKAYKHFRQIRYQHRKDSLQLNSLELIEGLDKYSERGFDYVEDLRVIINSNQLTRFDE